MKEENAELKERISVATKMITEEREILHIEKEQHQFEINELKTMIEDVNCRLAEKDGQLVGKDHRIGELETMVATLR